MVAVKSEITTEDALQFEGWLHTIADGRSKSEIEFIRRACKLAQHAHQGQTRASGEPYFQHSLSVANILADLRLDHETLAAAVLHDVLEDTDVTLKELQGDFGPTVAQLVDGVTKMGQIQEYRGQSKKSKKEQIQAESLRKMFLAMVDDIRVVLIKLADRTHNMRTLHHLREEKRKRIARETMEIFAPLANRLGIWQIKWELEDLAFRYMEPEFYAQIVKMVDERRINREWHIAIMVEKLNAELQQRKIKANVMGQPRYYYSLWREMKQKGVDFDQVYDVRMRVLLETVEDCYATLGVIHMLWRPIPGEFDDYVATPKDNLYRSLHTAIVGSEGKAIEIQIRTFEMDRDAEFGVAAFWRFKEDVNSDVNFEKKITWLRQLMEWKEDVVDAREFIDHVKAEVFQDRVHVLTPRGNAIELPLGATPIDFAYYIHTEVGHRCRGAKVNGRIVSLNYQLRNGDQVEILTARRGGPSRDWLNPHLEYIRTSRARSKVRHWFKYQNYEENISQGRELLEQELHRLGLSEINFEQLTRQFHFYKTDDFLAAIGRNDISTTQIVSTIKDVVESAEPKEKEEWHLLVPLHPPVKSATATGVQVQGVGDMLTNLAQCCRPVLDDTKIIGYITRGRGVTIHRVDCPKVLQLYDKSPERLISVDWGKERDVTTFPVDVYIEAFDRPGLLRDITAVVANERINMSMVSVVTKKKEHKASVSATLDIANIDQLSRLLAMIEQLPNVLEVRRQN